MALKETRKNTTEQTTRNPKPGRSGAPGEPNDAQDETGGGAEAEGRRAGATRALALICTRSPSDPTSQHGASRSLGEGAAARRDEGDRSRPPRPALTRGVVVDVAAARGVAPERAREAGADTLSLVAQQREGLAAVRARRLLFVGKGRDPHMPRHL